MQGPKEFTSDYILETYRQLNEIDWGRDDSEDEEEIIPDEEPEEQ